MSVLKDQAYINKIRDLEIENQELKEELDRKDKQVVHYRGMYNRAKESNEEFHREVAKLKGEKHTILGSQVNKSEIDALRNDNDKMRIHIRTIEKQITASCGLLKDLLK